MRRHSIEVKGVSMHVAAARFAWLLAALCIVACEPGGGSHSEPFSAPSTATQPTLVQESDLREPKKAESVPPPIQGGSLLVLRDSSAVVVGDPDRHRIVVVSLRDVSVRELKLPAGAEPGRAAEDDSGLVHVVLRGTGKLFTLDPRTVEKVRQRTVCKEPRGLAYESEGDTLHLACADGVLWRYAASTAEVLGQRFIQADLRDVALADQGALWLTTFRSAHVLRLEADGSLAVVEPLDDGRDGHIARAAWRLVSSSEGDAVVVHQRAATREIQIEPHKSTASLDETVDAGAGSVVRTPAAGAGGTSSYGGGGEGRAGCDSIVRSAMTRIYRSGGVSRLRNIADAILPVDVAVSSNGASIAIVSAGPRDPGAPVASLDFGSGATSCVGCGARRLSSVRVFGHSDFPSTFDTECFTGDTVTGIQVPAIAVAFVPDESARLVVLTRDPSRLYVVRGRKAEGLVELGGGAATDTGHELFHRDSGGGIACASCHLEGTDDGQVWAFSGLGKRRTQPLNVRLRGTQPFHWDGDMDDLDMLMGEVFVGRMGGAPQSKQRVKALGNWVFALAPWKPQRAADDVAALRGKKLFESGKVGCTSCHSGTKLTNNESVDVGTSDGVPLQVPSLLGVGYRAPLMHTGCAATLRERFEPACGGGDEHGQTSHLSASQLDDLVAYLQTL